MNSVVLSSRLELLGNLVSKQVTLRYFADGEAITQVDIVTKRKRADKSEQLDYFTLSLRGLLAEQMAQYGKAGQAVHVVGHLKNTRDNGGKILSGIDVEQLNFVGDHAQMSWNKLSLLAEIKHISVLGKGAGKQASIRLDLILDEKRNDELMSCQLWGFPAEFVAKQAKVKQSILIDGELRQYKPSADSAAKLSITGRTCQLFKHAKD